MLPDDSASSGERAAQAAASGTSVLVRNLGSLLGFDWVCFGFVVSGYTDSKGVAPSRFGFVLGLLGRRFADPKDFIGFVHPNILYGGRGVFSTRRKAKMLSVASLASSRAARGLQNVQAWCPDRVLAPSF